MQLCLVRHAIALDRGTPGLTDEARPLTDEGRARMEQAAAGLTRLIATDAVFTSPYLRAVQTAEIVADAFGIAVVRRTEALVSGDDDGLFTLIQGLGESVIAVGHEPHMSRTLSYALIGSHDGLAVRFKKGAAALITFDGAPAAGAGTLEWLIQPAGLRALARA